MAEGSNGVPSHLKNLHPMLFMTAPDGNVVVQIQTRLLQPRPPIALGQSSRSGNDTQAHADAEFLHCAGGEAGCRVLSCCGIKQQNVSKLAPRGSNHQL